VDRILISDCGKYTVQLYVTTGPGDNTTIGELARQKISVTVYPHRTTFRANKRLVTGSVGSAARTDVSLQPISPTGTPPSEKQPRLGTGLSR
jgi:1-acyl-sn-glycerol-3-phosphate acyltransferase